MMMGDIQKLIVDCALWILIIWMYNDAGEGFATMFVLGLIFFELRAMRIQYCGRL